jgi:hypothetical protein
MNGQVVEEGWQNTIYTDVLVNGRVLPAVWESRLVPVIPPDLPVSPPCSPRDPLDGGDEEDDYDEYDVVYDLLYVLQLSREISRREIMFLNKNSIPKNIKKQRSSKSMRRMGKLKQPGGASCNQRR